MFRNALTRTLRPPAAAGTVRCGACGKQVVLDRHAVRVHGEAMHAHCVLYSPRRRAA